MEIKIEPTSKGIILKKKTINGKWEFYYSIAGSIQNSCEICGYPLKKHEICSHHEGFNNINISYGYYFSGYYQTDLKGSPINDLSERILKMKSRGALKFFDEIYSIFEYLYNKLPLRERISWGSWVPTTNRLLESISVKLIQDKNISLLNPYDIIDFNDDIDISKNVEKNIKLKYKWKEDSLELKKNIVKGNIGVLIDDLVHTGYTIGRVLVILKRLYPKKIYCITLARTTRGKHPLIIKYPNI